jgi:hypothetical protein
MILYHGTTHDFTTIDVTRGKPFKDFGQGFYATAVYEHALRLALRNRRIEELRLAAIGNDSQLPIFVYTYEFDLRSADRMNVKYFESADREWLKFIILNRTHRERQHDYDLVIGPTANDHTRTSIRTVTNTANGVILSDAALDLLLIMLEPDKLPTQYYFGSTAATELLYFKKRSVL